MNSSETKTTSNRDHDESPAAWIAVDWADNKHDVALLTTGSTQTEYAQIDHQPEALVHWVGQLRERFGGAPVGLIVEQKRGAFIHALLGHEFFRLYPVNPAMLANLRKAFHLSGAKDDPLDRDLLLEILLKHRDRLHRWSPDDETTRLLGLLVEERRDAVDARTKLVETLLATLKGYCPALLDLVGGELSTTLACKLITKWPTFAKLRAARPQTVRQFFYAHNFRRSDKMEQRLAQLAQAVPLCRDGAVITAYSLKAVRLAREILVLLPIIDDYDKRIAALFATHCDREIFASLPGAGKALAPRLLVAFGTQRSRWSSSEEIATYSGIAPVTKSSGNKRKPSVTWRWACPKFLRQSFHEFAACSVPHCPWAKAFYQKQITRGKKHHAAVRSLAFKWIRILYRCWRDRCPYDKQKYLLKPVCEKPALFC
jgi:transposase